MDFFKLENISVEIIIWSIIAFVLSDKQCSNGGIKDKI